MSGRAIGPTGWPIVDHFPIEMLPIVQPGAADMAIVDLEAQRTDEPQLVADGHAGAADIPGVERDFRLIKHDLEDGFRHDGRLCPVGCSLIVTKLTRLATACRGTEIEAA